MDKKEHKTKTKIVDKKPVECNRKPKTEHSQPPARKRKTESEDKKPIKRKRKPDAEDINLVKNKRVKMGQLCSALVGDREACHKDTSSNSHDPENYEYNATIYPTSITTSRHQNNKDDVWDEAEVLAHLGGVPRNLADSFVKLLNEGCTLPFIARYRKGMVGNMMPDRLQELFQCYQTVSELKKKTKNALENLKKTNKLTPDIERSIINARNLSDLDLVYAPLKERTKTLAEKARNLGLEQYATRLLNGEFVNIITLCDLNEEELCTPDKVEAHIIHIIADVIYKDPRVLEQMRKLKEDTNFSIESTRTKSSLKASNENSKKDSKSDPDTYKIYFEFRCAAKYVKPHQTLAINRGEDEKVLSVKVVVPDWFYNKLEKFCLTLWRGSQYIKKALTDAYTRLIKPWLSRQVRAELTVTAQKEAIKTFTTNLEKYLLTEPIKNRRIAGLDPGFRAGCKIGIIDSDGQKLDARTIKPDFRPHISYDGAANQLKELLKAHKVELIGLGNGTACRETETWLNKHNIAQNIPVIIVPEQGASIYSISKEATKEHPNMDPNLISALSIARRVLDPLGELIKVEPKNLGVGLYQHDIPEKMLESALASTVEKVVSLVGADINTASHALLRRIAGLNDSRAQNIIAYRQQNGGFKTRSEILKVKAIGKVTFEQCAGFLKVIGGPEPLDSTIIHPESYNIAKVFAKKLDLNVNDISESHFPATFERKVAHIDIHAMSRELATDECTMELIINAFKQVSNETVVSFGKPIYSICVQATEQLKEGMTVTGVVRNVVSFGCFVDCGVGDNGLIHSKHMGANQTPKLGDKVSVTVIGSPKPKRIQLKLVRILD